MGKKTDKEHAENLQKVEDNFAEQFAMQASILKETDQALGVQKTTNTAQAELIESLEERLANSSAMLKQLEKDGNDRDIEVHQYQDVLQRREENLNLRAAGLQERVETVSRLQNNLREEGEAIAKSSQELNENRAAWKVEIAEYQLEIPKKESPTDESKKKVKHLSWRQKRLPKPKGKNNE